MKAISACLVLLASAASAAMPKGVLYVRGQVSSPEVLMATNRSGKACRILWDGTGEKPVLALDMGAPSVGGYAVFNVTGTKGRPTLRLAYANHPDGLGEKGCFARETSARYLGPDFDIPVLPGNINRHEIYSIGRTGLYVAPLIQGQERYVRVQLDTPGEVSVGSFEIVNADAACCRASWSRPRPTAGSVGRRRRTVRCASTSSSTPTRTSPSARSRSSLATGAWR